MPTSHATSAACPAQQQHNSATKMPRKGVAHHIETLERYSHFAIIHLQGGISKQGARAKNWPTSSGGNHGRGAQGVQEGSKDECSNVWREASKMGASVSREQLTEH